MAGSDYAIIPKLVAKTAVASAATALYSASLLVPAFLVQAGKANSVSLYLGASDVAANKAIALNARESLAFDPHKQDREETSYYDLSKFYIRATAASQVAYVMILNKSKDAI